MSITEKKGYWLDVLFRDRVEFPGNAGLLVPGGANSERPTGPLLENGYFRYNEDSDEFEGYKAGGWTTFSTGAGAGENNSAVNVGTGVGVFRDKTGVDLNLRTVKAGSSGIITVVLSGGGDEVLIDSIADTLFLPLLGGSMSGDIEMLPNSQLLADPTAPSTAAPIGFLGDIGTGFYQGSLGAGAIGVTNSGTHTWTFNSSGDLVPASDASYDIGSGANHVASLYGGVFSARNGSEGAPSFTFTAAPSTGMYREASGGIGWSISGTGRWRVTTAGNLEPLATGYDIGTAGTPVRSFYGRYFLGNQAFSSLTSPTHSFLGDTNTGMYWPGADTLGFCIGGNDALQFLADGTLRVPAVTAGAGSYENQVVDDDDIPNKKYVDDAIADGAVQDYRLSFTSGNLVANILTVTHNLGQDYPSVTIWDNSRKIQYPEVTSVDANSLTVDFTSWTVSGTWNVVVLG